MKKTILLLTLAGVLFSGYLSTIKLISGTCAFNEPCPYFLGYPACWYGFVMYLAMAVMIIAALRNPTLSHKAYKAIATISFVGVIFAGSFTVPEITQWMAGTQYELGIPTCAYGLIFYIIIFILSLVAIKKEKGLQ